MGRKAFFTEQQVFEAADSLVMQGKEVTAGALLTALGGGSLTTIYKHFEVWKAARPLGASTPVAVDVPEAVQIAFNAAWKVAANEAGRDVATAREKAAEEVRVAQKQFQEALQAIEKLEAEGEVEAGRIEVLAARVVEIEQALNQADSAKAGLEATISQQEKRIEADRIELDRLRADGEVQRQERDSAMKEAAELRGQLQAVQAQNTELLSRLEGRKK